MSRKEEYDKVARIGCICCRFLGYPYDSGVELHHVRSFGTRRESAPVIPLCVEHHRGTTGVHGAGKKAFARMHGCTEQDLLELVKGLLNG